MAKTRRFPKNIGNKFIKNSSKKKSILNEEWGKKDVFIREMIHNFILM